MSARTKPARDKGAPTFAEIEDARRTLAPLMPPTPLLQVPVIRTGRARVRASIAAGRKLWLKAENLQATGSFKIRGAYNRISRLEGCPGVIAASAGNHAQGVAMAAGLAGLPSTIVMPEETPLIKVERTRALKAEVILHGASFEDAFEKARDLGTKRGLTLVHAYEDRHVIAGQGTIGLEILDQRPDLQAVIVPVGGGGLISGIALALKALAPSIVVIGVQARTAAPAVAAFNAPKGSRPPRLKAAETIADAIRFKSASSVTMPIIRGYVDEMVDVTEEEIAEAIVRLMEETKLVAEGAGAVGVAALLSGRIPAKLTRVCAVISGGNIDLNMMARVVDQGLSRAGRYLVLRCQIPDKPGRLFGILHHLAERRINVLDVRHNRAGWRVPMGKVEVELLVETRNAAHAAEIVRSLEGEGYRVAR